MRLSTLFPLTLLTLATATPLPSSSQRNTLEAGNSASIIADPITSRSTPTTDSTPDTAPVLNKRCFFCHILNVLHDVSDKLGGDSDNDVVILRKKRDFDTPNVHRDPTLSRSAPIDDVTLIWTTA